MVKDLVRHTLQHHTENGDFVLTCSIMDDSLRCYKIYKSPKATVLFGNLSINPIVKELV